jgi:hypothetical protein
MNRRVSISLLSMFRVVAIGFVVLVSTGWAADAPSPLLSAGHPVDWWFVFKLNAKTFPECGTGVARQCIFGGTVQDYKAGFSQQFAFASSENAKLQPGRGCAGDTTTDPLGATFDQIYNGDGTYNYLIWNDQFYDDPVIAGCKKECGSPWGHSKGMLAWNTAGEGMVLQVSTPSWPAAGNVKSPRKKDGNTLGCVLDDDVLVSQHFFALKLTKDDLVKVLKALQNASVVTDPKNPQIVKNGGPADVQALVKTLGVKSKTTSALTETLSSGVELISKPSALNVPPWQMVSSFLKGVSLRAATWWASPEIPSTTASTKIGCWSNTLGKPGPVEIATTGTWNGQVIGLTGGLGSDFNHAKIGVSTSGTEHYAIFGDMNQQGTLSGPNCASSQDGRGGMFYVVNNEELAASVGELIKGKSANPAP